MESAGESSKRKRFNRRHPSSPFASAARDASEITEELEEKLVDSLMLLAKGICPMDESIKPSQRCTGKLSSRRFGATDAITDIDSANMAGKECEFMCGRTFSSSQALGGAHSTGHKQPEFMHEITKKSSDLLPIFVNPGEEEKKEGTLAPPTSQKSSGKGEAKLHLCSICGANFSSGQALGGHMTRHRRLKQPQINYFISCTQSSHITKKIESTEDLENQSNKLDLVLNLPALEDNLKDSNSELVPTSPSNVFPVTD